MIHAAKIFGLVELEKLCAESLKSILTVNNVGDFTSQALECESKASLEVCEEYFRANTDQVIKSEEFLSVSIEVLEALYGTESITCSELDLFLALLAWAKSECKRQKCEETPENLQRVVRNVVAKVRFPIIPVKEIMETVVPKQLLTHEDVGRLIYEAQTKQKTTGFSNEHRTNIVKVEYYCIVSLTEDVISLLGMITWPIGHHSML